MLLPIVSYSSVCGWKWPPVWLAGIQNSLVRTLLWLTSVHLHVCEKSLSAWEVISCKPESDRAPVVGPHREPENTYDTLMCSWTSKAVQCDPSPFVASTVLSPTSKFPANFIWPHHLLPAVFHSGQEPSVSLHKQQSSARSRHDPGGGNPRLI